jgi:hypothetical protein
MGFPARAVTTMKPYIINRNPFRPLVIACLLLAVTSYAAAAEPAHKIEEGDFRERIQTQEMADVRVSAGVPSANETKDLFGAPLYKRGIQPVWVKIENNRDEAVSFLPVGLDPAYYSPMEAANIDLDEKKAGRLDSLVDEFFFEQGMGLSVPSGGTNSGFIFSKLDEGTKAFNVDVAGGGLFETFTFFIQVPGLRVDHYNVDWNNLYPPEKIVELNEAELIEWLKNEVCCTTDKKSEGSGDPVNLVVIGDPDDVYTAFIRAGWDETETITKGTSWKTMKSFVGGSEYRYSPVSGLYVFGRPQDIALQKARDNIHERNHLRLWMSAVRFEGKAVWLGQISRDIGVRFAKQTITTHKVDPDVDETREYLLENLAYGQALEKFAYVNGVGEAPMTEPRGNLTGDPYFTDGYRLVLWVTSDPVDIADVEFVEWRLPHDL